MQPGQTIAPGTDSQTPDAHKQPSPAPIPEQSPAEPEPTWEFRSGSQGGTAPATPAVSIAPVGWTASEYVAHHKGASWFMLLGMAIFGVAAGVYLVTQDVVSTVVVVVVGIIFGAFGVRKPQVLEYIVDATGIHIGQKSYGYDLFKSFSVLEDGGMHSILLMPAHRTGLPITIYYEPKDEVTIVEAIGASLPLEVREPAAIDRFMSKIRF